LLPTENGFLQAQNIGTKKKEKKKERKRRDDTSKKEALAVTNDVLVQKLHPHLSFFLFFFLQMK
jgi:uncharacterized protein with gpF-like domain